MNMHMHTVTEIIMHTPNYCEFNNCVSQSSSSFLIFFGTCMHTGSEHQSFDRQ